MQSTEKQDWAAGVFLLCALGVAGILALAALWQAAGYVARIARADGLTTAQGIGVALVALALALLAGAVRISRWAGAKLSARRMWRRVDRRMRRERAGGVQCR